MKSLCDSERTLVEDNIRLVYYTAWQMLRGGKLRDYLVEDAISEGMCGLMKAAQQFDPSKGYQFSTMATTYIRNQIRDFVVKEFKQNKLSHLSIDEPIGDDAETSFADTLPARNDTEDEAVDWLNEFVRSILNSRGKSGEYDMLMETVNGKTMVDIAKDRGVSKQYIHRKLGDAKSILCEELKQAKWLCE